MASTDDRKAYGSVLLHHWRLPAFACFRCLHWFCQVDRTGMYWTFSSKLSLIFRTTTKTAILRSLRISSIERGRRARSLSVLCRGMARFDRRVCRCAEEIAGSCSHSIVCEDVQRRPLSHSGFGLTTRCIVPTFQKCREACIWSAGQWFARELSFLLRQGHWAEYRSPPLGG